MRERPGHREYVDPSADGWIKRPDGVWQRDTKTGVEFLGAMSPREALTPEQVRAHYDRRRELERRIQNGDKGAQTELISVNESIEYLERYGPEVIGGTK